MNSDAENGQATDHSTRDANDGQAVDQSPRGNYTPEPSDVEGSKCRRSRRLSRPRPI
jgi:hypothetical protein